LNSGELMAVKVVELSNVSDDDMEEIRNEVRYSVYLLYSYKSTNTEQRVGRRHGGDPQ
jgi:hypothetical protein